MLLFSFLGSQALYLPNDLEGFWSGRGTNGTDLPAQINTFLNEPEHCIRPAPLTGVCTLSIKRPASQTSLLLSWEPGQLSCSTWDRLSETRSLLEATGYLVNSAASHLWPDTEQKHNSRELLRNFSCSGGGCLTMWPSGKRTKGRSLLKAAEMSFFERCSLGAAPLCGPAGCEHCPKHSLACDWLDGVLQLHLSLSCEGVGGRKREPLSSL